MRRIFRVKFATMVKYNGSKEAEYDGPELAMNVQAENAEDAIAKVRNRYVGEKREWEDAFAEPPIKHKGKVADIQVESVEYVASIDF